MPLPALVSSRVVIHTVAFLGVKHARSALEGADCSHCVHMSMRSLHSRRALFEVGALTSAPCGSGPTLAEAEQRLKSWGSQVDLTERLERGMSLSPSSPARFSAQSVGLETRSETVSFEELLEVVTRAVAKLNIEWPADKE